MKIFEDVSLNWEGKEYTIPSNRMMVTLSKIEEVITIAELGRYAERKAAPLGRIAQAFGVILREAGAKITDEEVYAGMFSSGGDTAVTALFALMQMMVPPEHLQKKMGVTGRGNFQKGRRSSSSKKRTKQQSGKAGSRTVSSGA